MGRCLPSPTSDRVHRVCRRTVSVRVGLLVLVAQGSFRNTGAGDCPHASIRLTVPLVKDEPGSVTLRRRARVHRQSPRRATWPAFAALVEDNNGVFGGCWCMGFHEDARGKEPPSASGSWRSGKARPMRPKCSTGKTAWAGVNSACPARCRGSETAPRTRKTSRSCRTGESRATRRQGAPPSRCRHCGARSALDLIADFGGGRERVIQRMRAPFLRAFSSRRSLDVRKPRIRPRPQDRQAPLGRPEGGEPNS